MAKVTVEARIWRLDISTAAKVVGDLHLHVALTVKQEEAVRAFVKGNDV